MNSQALVDGRFTSPTEVSSKIVCCTPWQVDWQWLAEELKEKPRQWYFLSDRPATWLEKHWRQANLAAIRSSWAAIRTVKQQRADLLITDGPQLSFWCALFAAWQNVKVHHIATSFHFSSLPTGIACWIQEWVFARINKFTVYSRAEREMYSQHFAIPMARFEMVYLATSLPTHTWAERSQQSVIPSGDYLCACGDTEMDFPTLMAAIKQLPHIPLVVVVKPSQQWPLRVPANVRLVSSTSSRDGRSLLRDARFLLLPQRHFQTPCDCSTLVTAMQLGKTFVVPDLAGFRDYAFNNSNGVLYKPGNANALAAAIADLWEHPLKREVLGENGQEFAEKFCSKTTTYKYVRQLLVRLGL